MGDRTPEQVITERLAAQRNGVASDGRGWYRDDAQEAEVTASARDLLAELAAAGYVITRAGEPSAMPDLTAVPWRQGRSHPANLWAATGDDWRDHQPIGRMDSAGLAAEAVAAHNAALAGREGLTP